MLLRVRVIPVARFYVSVGRTLRSVGSSGFALRLEKALQGAIVNESVVEGLLLGLGAAALYFLLASAMFVLIYFQVTFYTTGVG